MSTLDTFDEDIISSMKAKFICKKCHQRCVSNYKGHGLVCSYARDNPDTWWEVYIGSKHAKLKPKYTYDSD